MKSSTAIMLAMVLVVAGAIVETAALFGLPSYWAFGIGFLLQFVFPAVLIRLHFGPQPQAPRNATHDVLRVVLIVGALIALQLLPRTAVFALLSVASWVWAIYYVRYLLRSETYRPYV